MKKLLLYLSAPLLTLASCSNNESITNFNKETAAYDLAAKQHLENFEQLPSVSINSENSRTQNKIALGHRLYFDTQLSLTGNNSCNSCHNLATYGVDNKPTSPGDAGANGDRNSPTVLNAALHTSQFWDGRAKDVEEQAGMPILNPVEMAIPSKDFLVNRLKDIPSYVEAFKTAFPNEQDPLTYDNLQKAIAVFERELITPSRFDQFLAGNDTALSVQEKKGLISFNLVGCTSCHAGATLGGQKLQKFGIYEAYAPLTKSSHIDYGRFQSTGDSADLFVFKVPSLRNIEKTGPYFHDGSVKSLEEVVKIMAKTQLGKTLSASEAENITAFLKTLTGEVPKQYTKAP